MEAAGVRPVRIIEIVNPFRPDVRTGEVTLAPIPGEYLSACMKRAGLHAPNYAIRLNDEFIEAGEEDFHLVRPGDKITCAQAAAGGALRILSMVAILAVTTALTGGLGDIVEAMAWTALGVSTPAMAAAVAAGISIGGGMLVSAFLGPSAGGGTNAPSLTYDPTGPKSLAQPGTPIPKSYGKMGWAGNIVSSFVDQAGKDEYLNILVAFGFGTATNAASILLNGKPIATYPDLSYQMRYGTNDQTPIPGFDTIRNVFPQEIELLAANPPTIVTGTGSNTTGLQIALKFPGGLMRTDSGGSPKEVSLAYRVEVSPSGANTWTTPIFPRTTADVYTTDINGFRHYPFWVVMPTDRNANSGLVYSTDTNVGAHTPGEPWSMTQNVKIYDIDNTNTMQDVLLTGEWQPTSDIQLDLQSVTDWWGGWRIVSNMTDQSFYDVVNVYGLTVGKWDCRLTKYGAGPHNQPIPAGDAYLQDPHYTADAWLWDVTEMQFADLAYPNMCLLGIRALATTQLSGANVTVLATWTHDIGADTVLPDALAGFEHDNPAIVAYDILMNPLYGMASSNPGIAVDVPAFVNLANFCDELVPTAAGGTQRRFVFAGVFDVGGSNAWQCLQQVGQMCRAQFTQEGNLYSVWADAPTDITQVFTEANIIRGTYSETFVSLDDRATQVDVTFADSNRNWRTDLPVSIMTASTINGGIQPKLTQINMLGCTNRDQAWQWAYFNLLSTETLMRTAKWQCAIEAVTCKRGSVVGVQQRAWSLGGRIQAGSTATNLIIDRSDLPALTGGGWIVGIQHPVFTVGTATIQSVASVGNNSYLVTFTGTLPAGRILRIAGPGGIEAAVLSVTQSGGANSNSLTMNNAQGAFVAGQAVSLYDYDRLETQAVSAINGLNITTAAFSQVPTPDAPWFYAQGAGAALYRTFRVTSVKQSGDFNMEISGLEYNSSIYGDVTPSYGEIVSFPQVSAGVSNLTLTEKLQYTTNTAKSAMQAQIFVSWDNGPNTQAVDIYGQVDGGAWNLLASKASKYGWSFPASTGDVWSVIVVGCDPFGAASLYNAAPMATITVQGIGSAPLDVTPFNGAYTTGNLTLTWGAGVSGLARVAPPVSWVGHVPVVTGFHFPGAGSIGGGAAIAFYEIRYNSDPHNTDWNTAVQVVTNLPSTTTSYSIASPGTGVYLIKALSANYVESINASSFAAVGASSSLNSLGNIASGQPLVVTATGPTYDATSGKCSLTLSVAAQTLLRADGTSFSVPAGSLTWTKLLDPSTTYYVYTFLSLADGSFHSAAGDPPTLPDTTPNPQNAVIASSDITYQGPLITVTTPSTGGVGGGAGGGNGVCPDGREQVITLERGTVSVSTVQAGEHILGYCFESGDNVYRTVQSVRGAEAWSWYRVNGYRMSPLDPVWLDGEWKMPYRAGTFDGGQGERIQLAVEADEYDQQNYYLVDRGDWLLIHNMRPPLC